MTTVINTFLTEVAMELADLGITDPTTDQIADAMLSRINRQGAIFSQLFTHSFSSMQTARQHEALAEISGAVYNLLQARVAK